MDNTIAISYEKVRSAAADLRSKEKAIRDTLATISQNMDKTREQWESDAADGLRGQYSNLKVKYADFENAIEEYAKFLDTAANAWESFDKQTAAKASELQSEYNG